MDKPGSYRVVIAISIGSFLAFILGLLNNAGSHFDPLRIVQMIPEKLEISGLKDAIAKVFRDYGHKVGIYGALLYGSS